MYTYFIYIIRDHCINKLKSTLAVTDQIEFVCNIDFNDVCTVLMQCERPTSADRL